MDTDMAVDTAMAAMDTGTARGPLTPTLTTATATAAHTTVDTATADTGGARGPLTPPRRRRPRSPPAPPLTPTPTSTAPTPTPTALMALTPTLMAPTPTLMALTPPPTPPTTTARGLLTP